MIAIPESEIQRLVRTYRTAIQNLASEFAKVPEWERASVYGLIQQNLRMLESLDKTTRTWAKRNIGRLYKASQNDTARRLREFGLDTADVSRKRAYALVNQQAVQALLSDPKTGIIPAFSRAIDEVKARMLSIQTQARVIRQHQKLIDETIARVGILEGRDLGTVQEAIVKELTKPGPASDLVWRSKTRSLPPGHILRDLADLPYVTYRTATGERLVRLETYAELLARTKTAQALGLAQRNKLLENGRALVQVSNNLPLQDDACALYMGKVFALTEQAAKAYGIAHVDRLPSGGCPFHPNCTHDETPYFMEYEDGAENRRAFFPTPKWALDKTWPQVQKEYEKRGGIKAAAKDSNPQLYRSQYSGGKQRHGTPKVDLGKPWDPTTPGPEPGPGLGPGPLPKGGGGPKPGLKPSPKPGPKPIPIVPSKKKPMPVLPPAQTEVVVPPTKPEPAWLKETKEALQSGVKTSDDAVAVGKSINGHVDKVVEKIEKTITDLNRRSLDLMQEIRDAHAADDWTTSGRANREFAAVTTRLERAKRLSLNARQRALSKALRRVRTLDQKNIDADLLSSSDKFLATRVEPILDDLAKVLPRSWIDRMNGVTKKLEIEALTRKGRSYYDIEHGRVVLQLGKLPMRVYTHDVLFHEMGHRIEDVLPDVKQAVREYFAKRTKGAKLKWMGPGYRRNEKYFDAGWTVPYVGKYYKGGYTSEIMSMGIEALFSKGGMSTAARVLEDKDLINFVVGVLGGIL